MSQYEKKRSQEHTQAYEPAHKRHKSWSNGAEAQQVKSANDRFAESIYKGRTLINKTPQKIVFDDDAPATGQKSASIASLKLSRKKSVTFTPETKNEDGATGQNFSKMWLSPAATGRADAGLPDVPTPTKEPSKPAVEPPVKPKAQASPRKSKKSKKPVDEHEARSACRAYLELFHNDHANWKFNKARQNDLLRHLWNIEAIPTSYNNALVAYIKGLSGAAAQQRLADGIVKILDPLLDTHRVKLGDPQVDTPEERRDAYNKVVELQRDSVDDSDDRTASTETAQAERAALLMNSGLWTLLRPAQAEEEATETTEPVSAKTVADTTAPEETQIVSASPVPPVSKRKSRKTRTATYSSSESSSSDDSDSDSDSD